MIKNYAYIAQNLEGIKERIKIASKVAGRNPNEITIVAVSKTFSKESIIEANNWGINNFGESYYQEASEKIKDLSLDVNWHFIGHLQKNKVRPVLKMFDMIQSIDSKELLFRVERIASQEQKKINLLLQVNVAEEEKKKGLRVGEIIPLLEEAEGLNFIKICGLMLIPPFYEEVEKNRRNFSALREISEKLDRKGFKNWSSRFLSMGMTDDFEIAIEEGSNMVRVGRAVFGYRGRKK